MIARRILLASLVLLSACAINPEGWEAKPSWYPLMPVYVQTALSVVRARCGDTNACAVRDYRAQECRVLYAGQVLEAWLKEHEDKHCAGFDHARWPVQVRFQ